MTRKWELGLLLTVQLLLSGCGTAAISGGTTGSLSSAGNALGDIQITAYQNERGNVQQVGFAVTAADGTFALVRNGAAGALNLEPGEYCFTLESVGAPVVIPDEYLHADKTPLKLNWASGSKLDFEIPGVHLQSQQPQSAPD